jgi:hypothetical protein
MTRFGPALLILIAIVGWNLFDFGANETPGLPDVSMEATPDGDWRSGQQVRGAGKVIRVLADDNEGSRHQRFIVRLGSGRTILIAHNIDLAPRVPSLETGDAIRFYGEYEWNQKGGVVHWTHHDPQNRHTGGWIEHNGKRYE